MEPARTNWRSIFSPLCRRANSAAGNRSDYKRPVALSRRGGRIALATRIIVMGAGGAEMMKIAVVGATGATGRRVVKHALTQGHFVTAVARHPERLSSAARLSFVRADVLSPSGLTG